MTPEEKNFFNQHNPQEHKKRNPSPTWPFNLEGVRPKEVDFGSVSIEGCEFNGVKWEASAIEAVTLIASALQANAMAISENAMAANRLVEVLRASNVNIETMVKLDGNGS